MAGRECLITLIIMSRIDEEIQIKTKDEIQKRAKELTQKVFAGKQYDISLSFEDGSVKTISLEKAKLFEFIYMHLLYEYFKLADKLNKNH